MCGIIGILGQADVAQRLVDGLSRLEYRGYDSAGIATLDSKGAIDRRRAEGKLDNLRAVLRDKPLAGRAGIGHTRWATHGLPNTTNAHPHATGRVAIVHNGIIENFQILKDELEALGVQFETETDTEIVARLVTRYMDEGDDARAAVNKTLDRLEGAYSLAMIFTGEDNLMIGARHGTPLALGHGDGEMYLASDSYALAPLTSRITFLEDGDRVFLTREGAAITTAGGETADRPIRMTAQSGLMAGKGDYRHYMLKEIHEQPAVIADTLNSFINPATGAVHIDAPLLEILKSAPRLTLIACGTAYYACMVAKYWFESVARIPCEVDVASEFRYREVPLPKGGAALFVSQSGETLDTLEALRYCRAQGQTILSIVNTIESTIERESDYCLHTLAGPEIAVASTKATTCQLASLACLALAAAAAKGAIDAEAEKAMTDALRLVPGAVSRILAEEDAIKTLAAEVEKAHYVLYLGRGALYPVAMEGALKLKEISYITAEGLAAGEMKHGPIALIDDSVPVVFLAPSNDPLFDKTVSNISETAARKARVVLFSDEAGCRALAPKCVWSMAAETVHPFVAPILYAVPVQMLAYFVAVGKGTDVDQPRNLAKSVTVE